jgi:uncharacterized membrane protein YhaH (DUF805 family)
MTVSFADSVHTCFRRYATFEGRATRAEFWWFYLFVSLVSFAGLLPLAALIVIAVAARSGSALSVTFIVLSVLWGLIWVTAMLALAVPYFAVGCRRLHDRGQSGWLQLLQLVPYGVGTIVLIVFWALEGSPESNIYGRPPQ